MLSSFSTLLESNARSNWCILNLKFVFYLICLLYGQVDNSIQMLGELVLIVAKLVLNFKRYTH